VHNNAWIDCELGTPSGGIGAKAGNLVTVAVGCVPGYGYIPLLVA
jgi:hypothetical protein